MGKNIQQIRIFLPNIWWFLVWKAHEFPLVWPVQHLLASRWMALQDLSTKENLLRDDHMEMETWRFPRMGVPPVIIHLNAIFHDKPSIIWGFPIYGNPIWDLIPGQHLDQELCLVLLECPLLISAGLRKGLVVLEKATHIYSLHPRTRLWEIDETGTSKILPFYAKPGVEFHKLRVLLETST